MEGITGADYAQAKRICKDSEIEHLGKIMICMSKAILYC